MDFSKWVGSCLGLVAILLRSLAQQFPQLTEKLYTTTVYPVIRAVLDHTLVLLPFPAFYLLVVGLLFGGYLSFQSFRRLKRRKQKLLFFPRVLLNLFGWVIVVFLVFWGYNYYRIPLYQHLHLDPKPLSLTLLQEEMENTQESLVTTRARLEPDTAALTNVPAFLFQHSVVREEMKTLLKRWNLSWRGYPVVKQFHPYGSLRRLGIFGIYFPFTGEAYLDPSLHPLEKSFTMAHELAHGFGITNEGEANFMAWLVCSESSDPFIRYAAAMKLFRYQLNDLFRMDEEMYSQFVANIPEAIKNDIREIQKSNRSIRPFSLELSRRSNDFYLKSQGVKEGIKSYAQLPMLVHSWKLKD